MRVSPGGEMRPILLPAGCLAGALIIGHCLAAPDRVYAVGGSGWTLERFASGLAVLRTRVTTIPSRADASGTLLLTCEGRERRLLLDLPQDDLPQGPPDLGGATVSGRMLVARAHASPQDGFAAKVTIESGRRVTLADRSRDPDAGGVVRFARMLQRRPDRLNLLVSVGSTNLARDIPIHLVFTFAPQDAIVLDDVASTCDSDEFRRTSPAR